MCNSNSDNLRTDNALHTALWSLAPPWGWIKFGNHWIRYPRETQEIYGFARYTMLTLGRLRSKGASKRGHIATINLSQFHIQRQRERLNADPELRKTKQARTWQHLSHTHQYFYSQIPGLNCVSFTVFHVLNSFLSQSLQNCKCITQLWQQQSYEMTLLKHTYWQ